MARTERRSWIGIGHRGGNMRLDPDSRDRKGQCWCCSGWKRPSRRRERHDARAALRRGEDLPGGRDSYWAA